MMETCSAETIASSEMRALEAQAMASGAVTGIALMERAGQGVVEAVMAHWPEFLGSKHQVAVLCGPGNNGGDGYVIARLLHVLGLSVEVFALGKMTALPPDALANARRWQGLGPINPLTNKVLRDCAPDTLVIDALFGIGLSRPVHGAAKQVLSRLDQGGFDRVVAVDIPSGLDADTGEIVGGTDGLCAKAALTVTFHRMKPGHVNGAGPEHCGALRVADIGL